MVIESILSGDRIFVWVRDDAKKMFENGYFGKLKEDRLELSLIEAMFLLEKKKIFIIGENGKEMDKSAFLKHCHSIDDRFGFRYIVYRDLRDRGLPTRSGFKFGCDFRVYRKNANPMKRGKKDAGEHTKWIVFALPAGFKFSFPELSRAVRLAHNIRSNMLWAIVDKSGSVEYFSVKFFKP